MPDAPFEVDYSGTAYVLIRARSVVDLRSAAALREVVRRLVFVEGRRFLAVDLTGSAAYGPQGFSPLIGALKGCRDRGGDLYLVGATDMVRRVVGHDARGPVRCYATRAELDAALLGESPAREASGRG
jgi:anti-anti-sigma regulatory factor